jgi:ATP-binding protein involved in chromosome partitioning
MSYFIDPAGNKHHLFGQGGGISVAEKLGTQLLGEVPLLPEIREGGDLGTPIVATNPEGSAGKSFSSIAQALLHQLAAKKP